MALRSIGSCYYGLPKLSEGAFFAVLVQDGPVGGVKAGDRIWLRRNVAAAAGLEVAATACMER